MTTQHISLFAGLLIGVSIAVPVGPMGLLCIQRTLASGMRVGISTGLGAATVNVLYGALVIFGMGETMPLVASSNRALSFAGGVFLLWSAARTLMRRHAVGDQQRPAVLSPWAAYGSAVAFNATNPVSTILIVALLSPVVGLSAPSLAGSAALLLGMFTAATTWWVCLTGCVTLLRSRLSTGLLVRVNQAAGAVLTIYGALALARSAGF